MAKKLAKPTAKKVSKAKGPVAKRVPVQREKKAKLTQAAPVVPVAVAAAKMDSKTAKAAKSALAAAAEAPAPVVKEPKKRLKMTKAETVAAEKLTQIGQKWSSLFKKAQTEKPKPYNMRSTYEAKTPIMHKLLGWGYILANKNDRLEVIFKDGIRYLISNYKN